ncbi:hypothetical protein H311_01974 [Anncaliia algerae PRA109]|nr:hypothetical protein H311_01974 [Anncaliia algerae PRA109]
MLGSTIWTGEHKSYSSLMEKGLMHDTTCHKYNLLNKENDVHTQFVESFRKILKLKKSKERDLKQTRDIFFS